MAPRAKNLTAKQTGVFHGWRSGLEERVAKQIEDNGHEVRYEESVLHFVQPEKKRRYTPDFILDNGIIIETKGRFVTADRLKHLMIRDQLPTLDIRFVFTNPNAKIRKGSKTSYADWCTKNNFKFAKAEIPGDWYNE